MTQYYFQELGILIYSLSASPVLSSSSSSLSLSSSSSEAASSTASSSRNSNLRAFHPADPMFQPILTISSNCLAREHGRQTFPVVPGISRLFTNLRCIFNCCCQLGFMAIGCYICLCIEKMRAQLVRGSYQSA